MGAHGGASSPSVIDTADFDYLDAQQLCEMVLSRRRGAAADKIEIARRDHEIAFKQAAIDKLTHEIAALKRVKFVADRKPSTPCRRGETQWTRAARVPQRHPCAAAHAAGQPHR